MKWILPLLSVALLAQSGLHAPRLGRALIDGRIIPVAGLSGNLIPEDADGLPADDFTDTGAATWVLHDGRLQYLQPESSLEAQVPAATALFGDNAAWLPEAGMLIRADRGSLRIEHPDCPGEVAGMGPDGLLTRVEGMLTACGRPLVISSQGPALAYGGRLIYFHDGRLHVLQPDGASESFAMNSSPERIAAAGLDWVHVTAGGRHYLLRIAAGRVALSVIPSRGRR